MKKFITGLVAAVVLITAAASNLIYGIAEETPISGKCGENATWSFDDTTGVLTISGTGDMYTNYVPVEQWGYYQYKDNITEVVVKKGITYISKCAFGKHNDQMTEKSSEYPNLTKLTLSSTVKEIGFSAFYRSGLTSVEFSEGLETIGEASFAYTPLSGNLKLPESVHYIAQNAFFQTNIASINLNEGMEIGGSSFRDCDYIKEVTIPKNIKYTPTLTSNAPRPNCGFAGCDSLEKVIIQGGGTASVSLSTKENALGEDLFSQCSSLKEIIIDCDNIEYLKEVTYNVDGVQNSGTFWLGNNPTFYIYKNSTTEQTLRDAGYLTEENTVYIADFSKLETAISDAEGIETDKYTDESVLALTKAIESAKAVLEDLTSTQDEVDNAVKAIEDAKKALEEKEEPSSNPSDSSSNPSDSSNPSESSSNPYDSSNPSDSSNNPSDSSNPSGSDQPSNSGSSQPTSAQPATNEPTTAAPKVMPPTTTVTKPAKVKNVKLKAKKKKLNVSWKKVSGATGYEVKAATNSKFTKGKKTVTVKKNKVTIKNLKPKKKYFVKVRAYKLANGRKFYGKWSKVVKKKTK